MLENPLLSILDRDAVAEHLKQYEGQLALMRDLANYGSNLVIRSFNSSPKELKDVVVCGVLLKQVVAMVDAVDTLLRHGQVHAAFLQARAAFEASVYLQWILVSETERKAACYIVSNYRNQRLWASRVIKGSPEEKAFSEVPAALGLDFHTGRPTLDQEAQDQVADIDRILAQKEFQAIDAEFEAIKTKDKRKREPPWHAPLGPQSLRQIAKELKRIPEYTVFYGKGSQVSHSASYRDHVRFTGGGIQFLQLRSLANFKELVINTVGSAIGTYKAVLGFYRPAELIAFGQKYSNDWRQPFNEVFAGGPV